MNPPIYHAIIPAAGTGKRFNGPIPKQFMAIGDRSVLAHALDPFIRSKKISSVTIATSPDWATSDEVQGLLHLHHPKLRLATGGPTRMHTVLNCLEAVSHHCELTDWVLIHDAARPCFSSAELGKLLNFIDSEIPAEGVILALPSTDTLKKVSGNHVQNTISRSEIWGAQTPQAFPLSLLKEALFHAINNNHEVTDESSAIELLGKHPAVLQGSSKNIKITYPEDLVLAHFYKNPGL